MTDSQLEDPHSFLSNGNLSCNHLSTLSSTSSSSSSGMLWSTTSSWSWPWRRTSSLASRGSPTSSSKSTTSCRATLSRWAPEFSVFTLHLNFILQVWMVDPMWSLFSMNKDQRQTFSEKWTQETSGSTYRSMIQQPPAIIAKWKKLPTTLAEPGKGGNNHPCWTWSWMWRLLKRYFVPPILWLPMKIRSVRSWQHLLLETIEFSTLLVTSDSVVYKAFLPPKCWFSLLRFLLFTMIVEHFVPLKQLIKSTICAHLLSIV